MEENITLTYREKKVMEILKIKERWISSHVVRKGDREFDITIEGEYEFNGDNYKFSAWMPLYIVHVVDWTDSKIWRLSNGYGQNGHIPAQGYDWSGIRDSSDEAIWKMVDVALIMMGVKEGFWVKFWMESGRGHSKIDETYVYYRYEEEYTEKDREIFEDEAYRWAGHDMGGFNMMRFKSGSEVVVKPPNAWLEDKLKRLRSKREEIVRQENLVKFELEID